MPDSEIPDHTEPDDRVNVLGKNASVRAAASEPRSGRPGAEPFAAPLPSMRQDFRPGIWVEPEPATRLDDQPENNWLPPPLPRANRKRSHGSLISFGLAVVLPTLLLTGYYYLLAEDEYYSEFRFSVSLGNPVLPGGVPVAVSAGATGQGQSTSSTAALSSLLGAGQAMPGATTQNFIVVDYLQSPQVVEDLQKRIKIEELYAKPEIGWLERFGASSPIEKFESYFKSYVYSDYDQVTGLAVASVKAFRPEDAYRIAKTMADLSEDLVNRINERANNDAVRFAEDENAKAEQALKQVNQALLAYRAKEGIINPTTGPVNTNIALVQALEGQLIDLQTQLGTLSLQNLDMNNAPTVRVLKSQIASAKQQLTAVEAQIAHDSEGARALAQVVGRFEELTFDQQYAESMLTQTMQALDLARANAAAQHLYLEPYVTPALPEMSTYPKRGLNILLGSLAFFGAWLLGLLIVRSIQDHAI
jgi:capsular polysaccharide transport system permease protein